MLLTTIFLPLLGALFVVLSAGRSKVAARQSALVTAITTFALAAVLLSRYRPSAEPFAAGSIDWLRSAGIDIQVAIGLDGLSVWLFGLSALLTITAVLVSWEAIDERPGAFYALLLLLESGTLGVFAARDIILFYIFFEFTLIPLFFLIGVWGSEDRRHAAAKFFLYTLAGSLLTFLGLLAIVLSVYSKTDILTFSIPALTAELAQNPIEPLSLQLTIFIALFAGFAIKVPLFPLHTWLPLAHVQAPTAGSVILAGILLKIGTYGFLRFNLPMLPDATALCAPWMLWLAVIGIIYGALVALAQSDIKRLIAYSSVSHLGFCMLGLFAFNQPSVQGSVLQMVNHGLSTGGLFALVGMIYERYHTREISQLGGLAHTTPLLAFFFVLFTFSSIGLPGLNGFAGEFPLLLGMFERAWTGAPLEWVAQYKLIAVLAVFGVVLGAWYMLWLVERVLFGPRSGTPHGHAHGHAHGHHHAVRDIGLRETLALAPLVVFMVWIGLAPGYFFERMNPAVEQLTQSTARAFERHYRLSATVAHKAPAADKRRLARVD